jgi:membrane protein DedA with SNARE-associated domain
MQHFLDQYGYFALLVGTFFEGETAILIASSLIHKGVFELPYTILFAFGGSFISDWIYYSVGRLNGKYFISRKPKLKKLADPITNLFNRYQLQLLLSYRFLYGFRVVIPVVIGMSGFSPSRYLFYTVISGLIWATVVSSIGYTIGALFRLEASSFENNFIAVVIGFTTFGLLIGFTVKRLINKSITTNVL